MICLCCGREMPVDLKNTDNSWHIKCIKKFFGTAMLPQIDISSEKLEELALETVQEGYTVAGVQKKMSLHLSREKEARLTLVNYPTGFILKPQTKEFASLPEFEHLAMRLAEIVGIKTVPHALVRTGESFSYITRRVDRDIFADRVLLYAMEDFCQLSNRLTADKYRGSYESCGRIIKKYSSRLGLDISEFFIRVVFSFVIGNSDMHLKNFSLREIEPRCRKYILSEAYDMLLINVILPEDTEEMALTVNGKKRNIRRKDFVELGKSCGMPDKSIDRIIDKIVSLRDDFLGECEKSFLNKSQIQDTKNLIEERINRIVL